MMRYLVVLMVVELVGLVGCDDPVEPREPTLATVDPSVTELVAFNDAGQALWNEGEQAFFWDGSVVHELPFRGIDLGPNGGVAGDDQRYWKAGEIIELPGSVLGIDGQGRVWIDGQWWTPDSGFIGEAPTGDLVGFGPEGVGKDGSILESGYESDGEPACYRVTSNSSDYLWWGGCTPTRSTHNSLFLATTAVKDTRTEHPWSWIRFEVVLWDLNSHLIVVSEEGEVLDSEGNVLHELEMDATHALINDNNEILVMSSEGHIRIIQIE